MKCPNCSNEIDEGKITEEVRKCSKCGKIIGCICCLVPGTPEYEHCPEHLLTKVYKAPRLVTHDNQVFVLNKILITIGRDRKNDIVSDDKCLSRHHAQIAFDLKSNRWKIRDLNSTNGTFVNGNSIKEAVLKDDDYIQMGEIKVIFRSD